MEQRNRGNFLWILVLALLAVTGVTSASWAATYYVDASAGSDNNTGSLTAPWQTVAKVNGAMKAGDTVSFKAGGVWNEALVPVSGNSLSPTTYAVYGTGNKPKIKGFTANNTSYVLIQGFEIWNDGANFPVYIYNGANHISVKNCYVWASSSSGWWAALYVTNSNYNDFEYNTVEHQNLSSQHDGLALDQGCSHNIIKYNTTGKASHYSLSITGASDTNPTATSSYNYIGYNTVTNPYAAVGQNYTNANNNIIEHNTFSGGGTLDQYPTTFKLLGSNNVFRYNILKDMPQGTSNGRGLRLETYAYGGTWPVNKAMYNHVYGNVITNVGGTEGSNGAIYLGTNDTTGVATNAYNVFKNNVIFNNTLPYEITRQANSLVHDNTFVNNIVYRSNATNVVFANGGGTSVSKVQTSEPALWQGNIQANPMLDTSYKPLSGSPAIDGGAGLTTITSASGTGTSIAVADPVYFTDGMGIVSGDAIQIGSQSAVITGINYSTKVLTLDRMVTWTQGASVSLPYNGTSPDIGIYNPVTLSPPSSLVVK